VDVVHVHHYRYGSISLQEGNSRVVSESTRALDPFKHQSRHVPAEDQKVGRHEEDRVRRGKLPVFAAALPCYEEGGSDDGEEERDEAVNEERLAVPATVTAPLIISCTERDDGSRDEDGNDADGVEEATNAEFTLERGWHVASLTEHGVGSREIRRKALIRD
jgi:hypothetical protein